MGQTNGFQLQRSRRRRVPNSDGRRFPAVPLIPHLKNTDMGTVDVDRFELIVA